MGVNRLEVRFRTKKSRNRFICAMTEMLPEREAVVDVAFGPEDFGLWLVGAVSDLFHRMITYLFLPNNEMAFRGLV